MKPRLQYFILAALLFLALNAQIPSSGLVVYLHANRDRYAELPFFRSEWSARIAGLRRGYENSGLKVGDELVALNGQPVTGRKPLDEIRFTLHPREVLTVRVKRFANNRYGLLDVPVLIRAPSPDPFAWAIILGLGVFLPLSCLLVGFYVAFARPLDPLAWITMAMLTSFGHIAHSGTSWALWSPWRELLFVYNPIASNTWPLWLVLFGLYFPIPFEFVGKKRWPQWVLAIVTIVLSLLDIYGAFAIGTHLQNLGWLSAFYQRAGGPITILFTLYVFGFFYLLAAKKRELPAGDARRRMNVMTVGCTLALLPLLPLVLAEASFIPRLPVWEETAALLMLTLFPITMGYVIVVQRAMEVRMVVRTGVRYAIASTGLRVARAAFMILIAALTAHFASQSRSWLQAFIIASTGIVLSARFKFFAGQVTLWMDRHFFREAYKAEVILTDLSNSVASIRDVRTLVETVSRQIADSLHVNRIAVLLEQRDGFQPVYASGFNQSIDVSLPKSSATLRILSQLNSPAKVYFEDPQSWVHGAPPSEQKALQSLDTQVLLPVSQRSRILGLISLGPKRSEVPYSREDLQLLGAVASQTGLALENAELTESIKRETAQRERLDRELEIAREVQQQLFPQKLPVVCGLDFAGYCRPALGVGGDYYDFIRMPDDCLGVAIGDVSGKGIAAALMMASLQASLRGQTIKPCSSLSEMIQHINRLVYEASSANRYATFFWAQYEPAARKLRFVNAGHNAPIVYRKRPGCEQIFRLEDGGTVLGLFPTCEYSEATLQLDVGDILVAFTDGISEAMSGVDVEFGDDRLLETIRSCEARTAADIITFILDRVDGFTGAMPQHDDMTLVVVRVQ